MFSPRLRTAVLAGGYSLKVALGLPAQNAGHRAGERRRPGRDPRGTPLLLGAGLNPRPAERAARARIYTRDRG